MGAISLSYHRCWQDPFWELLSRQYSSFLPSQAAVHWRKTLRWDHFALNCQLIITLVWHASSRIASFQHRAANYQSVWDVEATTASQFAANQWNYRKASLRDRPSQVNCPSSGIKFTGLSSNSASLNLDYLSLSVGTSQVLKGKWNLELKDCLTAKDC